MAKKCHREKKKCVFLDKPSGRCHINLFPSKKKYNTCAVFRSE